ncbi:MAG TPA: DUF2442 domain-containing protein [Thermoanaerobaculia bacterium]|nr:DUF2442 domain-containing protein [Thermoanaerobaculia bacterium]
MKIVEVIPKENYVLYIKGDNGQTGHFDVRPFLESEAFSPLKECGEFERIHNGGYFVEWSCGADLSADTIQARWALISAPSTQIGAPADAPAARGRA